MMSALHLQAKGSFSQGGRMFSERSRGKQCMPNSVVAIALSQLKPVSSWTALDLDNILYSGDQIYMASVDDLSHPYMLAKELPPSLSIRNTAFSVVQSEPWTGSIFTDSVELPFVSLKTALHRSMKELNDCNSCIVILGMYAISVIFDRSVNKYYVFDAHSCDETGMSSPKGSSVVMLVGSEIIDIVEQVKKLARSLGLHLTRDNQFEVLAMSLRPMSTSSIQSSSLHAHHNERHSIMNSKQSAQSSITSFFGGNKLKSSHDGNVESNSSSNKSSVTTVLERDSRELSTTNIEKLKLISTIFPLTAPTDLGDSKPAQPYLASYPETTVTNHTRRFQYSWFKTWDWLEYSVSRDATFCFVCRKFPLSNSDIAFIRTGYSNWKHAAEKNRGFSKHAISHAHKFAICNFIEQQKRELTGATIQKKLCTDTMEKNRYYVKCIAEVIQFLVVNQLSFRGDSECEQLGTDASGLFLQLFEFAMKKDFKLQDVLTTIPTNAKYTSPKIQNEIIHIMSVTVVEKIMEQVNKSTCVALLADETRDKQGIEDLAIALRYVVDLRPVERCVAILQLSSQSAQNITSEIMRTLNRLQLNLDKLIAQAYDGASVMKGVSGGVQALISNELKRNILFLHCFNHQLHLVIVHAIEAIPEVKEYFDLCEQLYVFFKKGRVAQIYKGHSLKRLLVQRWSGHLDSIAVIHSDKESIISTLKVISSALSSEKFGQLKTESIGLLKQISSLSFSFLTEVMMKVLGYFKPVASLLQQKDLDIEAALKLIDCVEMQLQEMRDDIVFQNSFEAAQKTSESTDHHAPAKRLRKLPQKLSDSVVDGCGVNLEGKLETVQEYKSLYNSIVDHCAHELKNRFQERSNKVIVAACKHLKQQESRENLNPLCELLQHNSDNCRKLENLTSELQLAKSLIKQSLSLENFADELAKYGSAFSGMVLLTEAALAIPSSTATVESCFSHLTSVLRPQRLSMLHERKADLVLLSYNKDITRALNLDEFVLRFAASKTRKIYL